MANNRQSEMAMSAALFSHTSTTAEITSSLQNADPRRRVVSGQAVPPAHHHFFADHHYHQQQQHNMPGRMSHDGVTTAMHAAVPQMPSEYMHQPGYNNGSGGEQNVPMWRHDSSLMPATQLHPITEHPEPSGTANEQLQQQQQQTGKVRRNIFNGFRRVAKAVKTAAVATSRSEVFRKESISQLYQPPAMMSSRTEQPQRQVQPQPQFALYPGVAASPTIASGNWTNEHPESMAYSPRRTTMPAAASTDSHASRVLPISQPGPRQRSLTQQAPVSPIARLYSEGSAPSRSIDIQRTADTSEHTASSAVLGSGLPYSRPSDPPARVSPLTNALSPSRFRQRLSPDASHSSINSSASTGSMQAYHLGATNRSYDLSQSRRQPATPHTARSADAIPRMTSPVTTTAALSKPAAPILDAYPKRDRSMTLPSEPSNTYRQANMLNSLAPPPLPPRSAPRLRSYSGMPPSAHNAQQLPLPLTLGPEKIELSISGSPLFKPKADEDRVHSAGEFIHEQAVQNMSLADFSRDPSGNGSSSSNGSSEDHLMLQLPPPAAVPDLSTEKAEVMVDTPQYVSMMINSDKLKSYLKQVSDGEQAAEYQSMIRAMEAHEMTKSTSRNRQSVVLDAAADKSETPAANNDSGVQVDDSQPTGLGGMMLATQNTFAFAGNVGSEHGSMERIDDSKHMAAIRESGSTTSLSASTSRFSLPVVSNSSSNGGMAEPASIVGSPPSPFSFSHSRYSLINQDGSLNLASFQFDQLDGYQKRLSGSMGSLGSNANAPGSSLPQRSESKITDRLTRRGNNGEGGWFRSTLALSSSENHRERSTSPPPLVPARSPRLPFSSSTGDRLDIYTPDGNVARQSKLMRKARKPSSFALSTGSGGSGELPAMMGGSAGVPLGVFNFSMSMDGQQARQQPRVSESSYSGGERSNSSRRPSQTLYPSFSVHPVNRRPSDNTSIASQHSLYRPNNSSRTHIFADKPSQRLMYLGDISPFDMVYRSSVGSMSLEQALTLVEGTTDPTNSQQQQQQSRMSRHRRLHKRSASALNANELDDIMIQTAEMCHSIQTAIKMQMASESGLGRWIHAAFGEPQKPAEEDHGEGIEDEVQSVAESQHHLPETTSGPPAAEIEHRTLETVEESQDVPQAANDPKPVQDLHTEQPVAATTSDTSGRSDRESDGNGGYASSLSSSESSLEIWPSGQSHHQHLGGDTNSVTSSDESIDASDPVQTSLPPSPSK
ncbi:hypothetical protein GGI15_003556 [Coemansia interrupta]|uniref:Uncharacterized protein n=1 Tax=Coemansia interrupta TaxID=1126814 RepID=A0A9W8H7R3_9FUNG|nr:hypothetical protein GGI15_003556 [Coemansia interrupta]